MNDEKKNKDKKKPSKKQELTRESFFKILHKVTKPLPKPPVSLNACPKGQRKASNRGMESQSFQLNIMEISFE